MLEVLSPESLRQLNLMQLRSKRRFLGTRQGGNLSPKRGHGIEFADYRRYELGDDPRHIDWGVYGRTDRLYVKQFQEEQDLTFYCIIDCTSSLHVPEEDKKLLRAIEVGVGFSYMALALHNRVRIDVPGHRHYGPFSGVRRIYHIGEMLSDLPRIDPASFNAGFSRFLYSVDFPGMCVYVSDFLAPLSQIHAQLEGLYSRNLDVLLVRILGKHDINPFSEGRSAMFVDSETGEEILLEGSESVIQEYRYRFEAHSKALRDLFQKYQMRSVDCYTSRPLLPFFANEVASTGFLSR